MGLGNKSEKNTIVSALKEIFYYRELILSLAYRDIKIHYKQTFLGAAWAVFPALLSTLLFTFIHRTKILHIDSGAIPYPLFAYCGLAPWTFFVIALSDATHSLHKYQSLLQLVYFPRAVLPLSIILARLLNFFISSLFLIGMMLVYRVDIHITILAVPFLVALQFFFIAGLSFFLSVGHLFYRDVGYIVSGILPLLMFVTSVVYPIQTESAQLQKLLITLNPMIPIIDSYRQLLLQGTWPDFSLFAIPVCLCFSLFIIGLLFFCQMENLFAENV